MLSVTPNQELRTEQQHAALRGLVPFKALRFFVLAYVLTWAAWLPMLTRPDDWQWLHYLGALGPAIAGIVLIAHESGRAGLASLGRRVVRAPARWVLLAVGLPFALFGVGAAISAALGQPVVPGHFLGSKEYGDVGLMLIPIEVFFFGYGEEVGWRGYALDALRSNGRSNYAATTVLSMFWAGWHLPLFFYEHGLATLTLVLVPGWLLSLLFGGYLTTFLFRSSGNSLLVAAFFHGAVDLVSLTPAASDVTLVVVNGGLIAVAVAAVIKYAPTLNAHERSVRT
jgi:hypothetical protein